MGSIQLYHHPVSNNSRRVWIALLEKNLTFELIPVQLKGEQFTPEFLALNPFHHIPVLVDDGFRVLESLAILDYLEAQYPAVPLFPQSPEKLAQVRMIEMVHLNELQPQIYPLLRSKLGIEVPVNQQEKALAQIRQVLAFYESQLTGTTFIPEQFTVADIVAGIGVEILTNFLEVEIQDFPKVCAWHSACRDRASFQKTQPSPAQVATMIPLIKQMLAS